MKSLCGCGEVDLFCDDGFDQLGKGTHFGRVCAG